ncbi:hypothetical protein [Variovorax sp. PBL-E5]|uniref:hypothetical protein n=1 Tax=Variovorax sp. PBL-E5 TaxID=434014 RepID=UPI001315D054|nr:hypothetical protein [Variovorax sp. PBL-E5]VTU28489.1 hypothetical protein E5CHR_02619 [Variovorax sp. PBL-E5]
MGEARVKEASARDAAFAKSKMCIFCGGGVEAATVDHCPPRSIFSHRKWPEGYVFPACNACNSGSKLAENWVAFLSRMHSAAGVVDDEQAEVEMRKLAKPLLKPEVIKAMQLSAAKKRALARHLGVGPSPGETFADMSLVAIPEEAAAAIPVFARKIAKALHFEHTGQIVPSDAAIEHRWFTNYNLIEGKVPAEVFSVPTGIANLRRATVDLSNQFNYRYAIADGGELSIFTMMFRFSFCLTVLLTLDPTLMARALAEATERASARADGSTPSGE